MSPETETMVIPRDLGKTMKYQVRDCPVLIPENDPRLHTPTIPFDFENPPMDPIELYEVLRSGLIKYRSLGLSANQIGLPWSVFVYGDPEVHETISGVFNPKLVSADDDYRLDIEGCLSYPNLLLKIKRAFTIRVRYTTHNGVTDTVKHTNLTARIFQHEMDHLDGVVFTKRASTFHLDQARRKLKKLSK